MRFHSESLLHTSRILGNEKEKSDKYLIEVTNWKSFKYKLQFVRNWREDSNHKSSCRVQTVISVPVYIYRNSTELALPEDTYLLVILQGALVTVKVKFLPALTLTGILGGMEASIIGLSAQFVGGNFTENHTVN